MKIEVKKSWMSVAVLLVLAAAAIVYLSTQFLSMREVEPIYPGPGVTEIKMLSDWYPDLKGTAGDTEVYILRGATDCFPSTSSTRTWSISGCSRRRWPSCSARWGARSSSRPGPIRPSSSCHKGVPLWKI